MLYIYGIDKFLKLLLSLKLRDFFKVSLWELPSTLFFTTKLLSLLFCGIEWEGFPSINSPQRIDSTQFNTECNNSQLCP